jgi:AraC-like DNA-binding protein
MYYSYTPVLRAVHPIRRTACSPEKITIFRSTLKRASYRLAFEGDKRVIDIALEAGFESPEAFSRAFKRTFDQSPSEFRAEPKWPEWHMRFQFHVKPFGEKQINILGDIRGQSP